MKIYAISDLHLSTNCDKPMNIFGPVWDNYLDKVEKDWNDKVGHDDLVLIAGDVSWAMHLEDAYADLDYIASLPGKKVILRGNHDYWWKSISELRANLKPNMFAVQNDAIRFENAVVCGSRGWTVPEKEHKTPEDEKIYNRELIRMELSLKSAIAQKQDGDKVVVMIHYPPFNSKLEDSEFTRLFEKYGVDKVVYGHLHSYDKKGKLYLNKNGIDYYLTSCDLTENTLIEIL